ncbi:hypothetical protein GCM10007973_11710 [Polymorphobacter multimanifer]|uniref:Urea transporter n=1 Tax=Polymorphobacter multimanifer TaxID=1070431 RepID=A0A841LDP1_9SPHN|nr:hypothetical protein [Polymorphobacter multimanifer]MBB6227272.1 urea transporter [Polymorphobacter multimanifer]GGI76485.1 hypothetical protein GCM10007973_11710 [Polymorphobacter multimanifer]
MAIDPAVLEALAPVGVSAVFLGTMGWVMTTWMRVKNGYPLESSWGKPMLPARSAETEERVKLVAQENAQLRAELSGVKDRLAVLERIAVDRGARLAAEIDALDTKALN